MTELPAKGVELTAILKSSAEISDREACTSKECKKLLESWQTLSWNSNNHSLPCDESCTAGCSLECLCSWRLVHHWKGDYEVGTRLQIWKSAHIFNVFFAHLENGGRFFSTKLPNPVARALVFCLGISAFRTQCDDEDVKNIEFDQLDPLHDFFAQFR